MTYTEETILDNARNRFEEKGVQIQFGARNMRQAVESFNESCLRCSMFKSCTGHVCSIEKAFLHNTTKYHREIERDENLRRSVESALALDA